MWGGLPARPLIYLEELRADLHAFSAALELLDQDAAISIFAYNILLRFSVHVERIAATGVAPYGMIPFLLFGVLIELGIAKVEDGYLVPAITLDQEELCAAMRACGAHASAHITAIELAAASPLDAAMDDAIYVRRYPTDEKLDRHFGTLTAAWVARLARWQAMHCGPVASGVPG